MDSDQQKESYTEGQVLLIPLFQSVLSFHLSNFRMFKFCKIYNCKRFSEALNKGLKVATLFNPNMVGKFDTFKQFDETTPT